jgi:hypothetical protein
LSDIGQPRNLPLRHYQGFFADSSRWERFAFRVDDVVISTPAKCGTTWMQHIVGMLLLDRVDLGAPIGTLSPWLDMLTRTESEVFALLEAQTHRRFIKTHTPLDGVPLHDGVAYIAVVRHPLDVALSDRDHAANMREERAVELRNAVAGPQESIRRPRSRPRTSVGSSTTTDRRPAAARTDWTTTASRSARIGRRATRQTSICSTTRTSGRISTVRCAGWPRHWVYPSTELGGRRSWTLPGSPR